MGGAHCALVNCSAKKSKNKGLSFFKIPKKGVNDEWRIQLLHKINRADDGFNADTARICSRHFLDSCIQITQKGVKKLIPGSLPTEEMPVKSVETPRPLSRKAPTDREPPLQPLRVSYFTLDDTLACGDSNPASSSTGSSGLEITMASQVKTFKICGGGKYYCVICSNYAGKVVEGRSVSLHRVPRLFQRVWEQRLQLIRKDFKRGKVTTRVCSEHFVNKRGPMPGDDLPSIFPNRIFKTCTTDACVDSNSPSCDSNPTSSASNMEQVFEVKRILHCDSPTPVMIPFSPSFGLERQSNQMKSLLGDKQQGFVGGNGPTSERPNPIPDASSTLVFKTCSTRKRNHDDDSLTTGSPSPPPAVKLEHDHDSLTRGSPSPPPVVKLEHDDDSWTTGSASPPPAEKLEHDDDSLTTGSPSPPPAVKLEHDDDNWTTGSASPSPAVKLKPCSVVLDRCTCRPKGSEGCVNRSPPVHGKNPAILERGCQAKSVDKESRPSVGNVHMQRAITLSNSNVVSLWTTVGATEDLSSNEDIARFLLALYFGCENTEKKKARADVRCTSCKSTLKPMWTCLKCNRVSYATANVEHPPGPRKPSECVLPTSAPIPSALFRSAQPADAIQRVLCAKSTPGRILSPPPASSSSLVLVPPATLSVMAAPAQVVKETTSVPKPTPGRILSQPPASSSSLVLVPPATLTVMSAPAQVVKETTSVPKPTPGRILSSPPASSSSLVLVPPATLTVMSAPAQVVKETTSVPKPTPGRILPQPPASSSSLVPMPPATLTVMSARAQVVKETTSVPKPSPGRILPAPATSSSFVTVPPATSLLIVTMPPATSLIATVSPATSRTVTVSSATSHTVTVSSATSHTVTVSPAATSPIVTVSPKKQTVTTTATPNSDPGITTSGIVRSGITTSGIMTSGIMTSGITTSGIMTSGITTSGIITSGITTSGIVTSGITRSGIVTSGITTSGIGTSHAVQTSGSSGVKMFKVCGQNTPAMTVLVIPANQTVTTVHSPNVSQMSVSKGTTTNDNNSKKEGPALDAIDELKNDRQCKLCSKVFSHKDQLKNHVRVICGGTLKRKIDVLKKTFACTVCDKAFRNKQGLRSHMETHWQVKEFICDVCGRAFGNKNCFRSHMQTHTQTKKTFACTVCNKAFRNKQGLRRHMGTHSQVKEFICDVCGEAFRNKQNLRSHMVTHSHVKKFTCDVCGRAFAWSCNMRSHRRRHENPNYKPLNVATGQKKERKSKKRRCQKIDPSQESAGNA